MNIDTPKLKTQKTEVQPNSGNILDYTPDIPRICPSCLARTVISKGKQAKTGEMRAECKSCAKQFATLFSENMGKLWLQIEDLKVQLNKQIEENLKIKYSDNTPEKENDIEKVLRGTEMNAKKLKLVYFSNIKRNKISRIKETIVLNTELTSAQLINIDFAEDTVLEVFCWEENCANVIAELGKIKLVHEKYDPAKTDTARNEFTGRMESIYKRRSNTNTTLKRYAMKLSRLAKSDLTKELATPTKIGENTMAASVSITSSDVENDS